MIGFYHALHGRVGGNPSQFHLLDLIAHQLGFSYTRVLLSLVNYRCLFISMAHGN